MLPFCIDDCCQIGQKYNLKKNRLKADVSGNLQRNGTTRSITIAEKKKESNDCRVIISRAVPFRKFQFYKASRIKSAESNQTYRNF